MIIIHAYITFSDNVALISRHVPLRPLRTTSDYIQYNII
jgi:hypothetical protein